MTMQAPFPYFGGKSSIAHVIWQALGDVRHYLEPFVGSAAVLLARPAEHKGNNEIINDMDCHIVNVWRSIRSKPDEVAFECDYPVSHADLMARHLYLLEHQAELRAKVLSDPEYCDAKMAGYWVWGQSCWIGTGFCDPKCKRSTKIPHTDRNNGVHKSLFWPEIGTQIPYLTNKNGICTYLEKHSAAPKSEKLYEYLHQLSARLRRVTLLCGDWKQGFRTPFVLKENCGIFFDPPYSAEAARYNNIYKHEDLTVAHEVREWCKQWDGVCKIVLAGYEGEHNELEARGWAKIEWKANGGMANTGKGNDKSNRHRERLWLSPLCFTVSLIFG